MDEITAGPTLSKRPDRAHKGTFGRVLVVGGSAGDPRMVGAPALALAGALRAGCGLARVLAPEPILTEVLGMCASATGHPLRVDALGEPIPHEVVGVFDARSAESDAVVLGCGLGRSAGADALVVRAIVQEDVPVVLDADGLNALADMNDFAGDLRAQAILTPHPGEFARLAKMLRVSGDATDDDARPMLAGDLARRLGVVVVLKGARTVVSDGQRVWTCTVSEPCLATAGTGDVLAGVIGSIVAQQRGATTRDLFEAARAGVEAHARAATGWRQARGASGGMLAMELTEHLPGACDTLRG